VRAQPTGRVRGRIVIGWIQYESLQKKEGFFLLQRFESGHVDLIFYVDRRLSILALTARSCFSRPASLTKKWGPPHFMCVR